jgi:hypothetical protein
MFYVKHNCMGGMRSARSIRWLYLASAFYKIYLVDSRSYNCGLQECLKLLNGEVADTNTPNNYDDQRTSSSREGRTLLIHLSSSSQILATQTQSQAKHQADAPNTGRDKKRQSERVHIEFFTKLRVICQYLPCPGFVE